MRELKGRINSVHSSQKITGAMKMISSARLRKAENKLLQAVPYRQKLWEIYAHIERAGCDYVSPLALKRKTERVAVVIFGSDEGLAGAFNINLYKKLSAVVHDYQAAGVRALTVIPVGKKIVSDVKKLKGVIFGEHPQAFEEKDFARATRLLVDGLTDGFLKGEYDRVEVIYTYYKSMGVQQVQLRQFLPVVTESEVQPEQPTQPTPAGELPYYIYEPDCESILKMLYPLLLHALMYEMFLQGRTSEQAARILAMQMANDNAVKLLGNLQLEYNKLRQQGITTELLDIAGGTLRG